MIYALGAGWDRAFEYGELKVDFDTGKVTIGGRGVNLTPIEYRLLCQLIRSAGKIVSSRTILGLVWGREHLEETLPQSAYQAPS